MACSGVALVDHQQHLFVTATQHVGNVFIHRGQTLFSIDQEEDDIGLVDGQRHLLADFHFESVVAAHDITARINDGEVFPVPVGMTVLTVAGDARGFVDNGFAFLDEAVEES